MKAYKVNSLTSKDYKNLDVTKDHVKREDVELGPAARDFLKNVKSQRTRTEPYTLHEPYWVIWGMKEHFGI